MSFFAAAVEIAAPLVAVVFAAQLLLGLFAKSAPQANVFSLGFPLQLLLVLAGLGLAVVALPADVANLVERGRRPAVRGRVMPERQVPEDREADPQAPTGRREAKVASPDSPRSARGSRSAHSSLALPALGGHAVIGDRTSFMAVATNAMSSDDPTQSLALLGRGLRTVVEAAGPLLLVAGAAAGVAGFGQVGVRLAPGALGLKWNEISPMTGIEADLLPGGAWEMTKMLDAALCCSWRSASSPTATCLRACSGRGPCRIQATSRPPVSGLLGIVRDVAGRRASSSRSPTTRSSATASTSR